MNRLFGRDVATIQFRIWLYSAIPKNMNNKMCKNSMGVFENRVERRMCELKDK
jgi:hypothetical protein